MPAAMLVLLAIVVVVWLFWAGSRQSRQSSAHAARQVTDPGVRSPSTGVSPIRRGEHLSPEDEKNLVQVDGDGRINIRFRACRDEWMLTVPEGVVSPRSRYLYQHAMWVFRPRGTSYYDTYQSFSGATACRAS